MAQGVKPLSVQSSGFKLLPQQRPAHCRNDALTFTPIIKNVDGVKGVVEHTHWADPCPSSLLGFYTGFPHLPHGLEEVSTHPVSVWLPVNYKTFRQRWTSVISPQISEYRNKKIRANVWNKSRFLFSRGNENGTFLSKSMWIYFIMVLKRLHKNPFNTQTACRCLEFRTSKS